MGDSAGALLLRSGILTPDQLMAAHAARQQEGSTLGYHLVRMGLVDEEKLAEFYRHRLMVPRLKREALERIKLKVIERVPRDMAGEFRVIPTDVDKEGNLTLAMSDPTDTHAVDEVAFFTGHYVMRAVAAESDIEWALAKYYGILRPPTHSAHSHGGFVKEDTKPYHVAPAPTPAQEEAAFLLTQKKAAPPTEILPTQKKALPQAEPKPAASGKRKSTQPRRSAPVRPAPVIHRAPQAAGPTPAPQRRGEGPREAGQAEAEAFRVEPPARPKSKPIDRPVMLQLLDVVDQVRNAHDRDAVARWMLDFLQMLYTRTAFFVVKKGAIATFDARGQLSTAALRALTIPLDSPSLLHDVIASRTPYRGPLEAGAVNNKIAHALSEVPAELVLVPVNVRARVIGVIYADGPKVSVPDGVLDRLAIEAGAAYERILRSSKL
jgi:type II secretion system (T2SS) protein E